MKIVVWTNGFRPFLGGLETFSANLVRGLKAKGHEVLVITFQQDTKQPDYENWLGVAIYRFGSRQLYGDKDQLTTCKKIFNLIESFSPDILHLQFTSSLNLMHYLLLMYKIKASIVVTLHGLLDEQLEIYKIIAKKADHIVCVSKYLLDEANKVSPESKKKSSYIHNALIMDTSAYIKPSFEPPKLLCLGRLTSEKGYDDAIRSFHKISLNCTNSELYLVGDGPEKQNLFRLADDLGLKDKTHFFPSMSHEIILDYMKAFSIILIPSRYESFGMVAIEAGMMGRPVVSMSAGGLNEIILDGVTGKLVKLGDIEEFSLATISLINNPSLACEMGSYAYSYVRQKFSLDKMLSCYEKIYQKVCSVVV